MRRVHPLVRVSRCLDQVAVTDGLDRVLVWNRGGFYLLRLKAARYCKHHVVRLTADELKNGIPMIKWQQIQDWCKQKKRA